MTSKEVYERHLAESAPGTPLRKAMEGVPFGTATDEELIAYARWEMWEAIHSLPPDPHDEPRARSMDPDHASCCVLRAEGALRQLAKRLASRGDGS